MLAGAAAVEGRRVGGAAVGCARSRGRQGDAATRRSHEAAASRSAPRRWSAGRRRGCGSRLGAVYREGLTRPRARGRRSSRVARPVRASSGPDVALGGPALRARCRRGLRCAGSSGGPGAAS
ncbi:MAG: hypothetical protein MZV64_42355 [Ignavibacteriales bacterium]|nr:hypothetical protein [Ignavibacteriales bacterium]